MNENIKMFRINLEVKHTLLNYRKLVNCDEYCDIYTIQKAEFKENSLHIGCSVDCSSIKMITISIYSRCSFTAPEQLNMLLVLSNIFILKFHVEKRTLF
jgi:hypothetical protein